jgi:hypothetical protein
MLGSLADGHALPAGLVRQGLNIGHLTRYSSDHHRYSVRSIL